MGDPHVVEEKIADLDSVTLNYAEGPPSGPPLLLLHGGSARWQSFLSIIPEFANQWHLYALDLRGHGKSGRVPNRYRLQDYADDIVRFLEMCVRKPAALFGHSLGGPICVMAAVRKPAYVRAIILGDAPLDRKSWLLSQQKGTDRIVALRDLAGGQYTIPEIIDKLKDTPMTLAGQTKTMRQVHGENAPVFEWLATNLYHNDPSMLTALIEDFNDVIAQYDMNLLLPNIHCPVLLLQADPTIDDSMMLDADIEVALALLLKPNHIRLAGVGHPLHHLHKEPVVAAMKNFLASI